MQAMRTLAGALAIGLSTVPAARAQTADVIHWWTSGGESKAVAVFADAYRQRGGTWLDSAVVGGPAARTAATNRIAGGNPPTAMQWNTALALRELDDQGVLAQLDDVAASGNWKAALPPVIGQAITWHGHVIAVPLDMQNLSQVFTNTRIFADLGLQPPKTWDEFFPVADKIKAAGYIPLALAGQPAFIWELMQAVMLGTAGPDTYRQVFVQHDAKAAGSPGMVRAFEVFRRLNAYVDPGNSNRKWNDTALLVENGKAAMYIMGDWAKGDFIAAGQTVGKEFSCVPAPGTAGYVIISVDSFAFPKGKRPDADAARRKLAETLMDPVVQAGFDVAKGTQPARLDAKMPPPDACSKLTTDVAAANPGNLMPNNGLAFPPDIDGQLSDLVSQYWGTPGMSAGEGAKQFAQIIAGIEH